MMKKNMIRKMIIAAAMVLTMLPVQAEASSTSEIVKDDFKIIVSDFKKGSDSLGENPTVTEKNVQITYLEEGKYKLSYQIKLEGTNGSYEMQEPMDADFQWASCADKLSQEIPQTSAGSDEAESYSWKLTVTREACAAHQVEKIQKESNCTEQGYEKDGCVRCAYTVENTKITKDLKADKHDYTWKADENGSQMHICSYNEAHNGICGGGQEATCTAKSVCDICKKEYGTFAHEMAYTSDGAVITESCAKGCGHSATATLVLDPAVSRVYSGSEIKPLRVEYSANWKGGELAIQYHNNINATTESSKARGEIFKEEGSADVTFEIGKAALKMIADDKTCSYGDQKPNYTATVEGLVKDEKASDVIKGTPSISAEYTPQSPVGSYPITMGIDGLTADNYTITAENGTLTVGQRELSIQWGETEFIYDEAVHIPEATVGNTVNGDQIILTVSGETAEAGIHEAVATGFTGDNAANYKLPENVTTKFSILAAAPSAPTGQAETALNAGDGKIINVDNTMEYSADAETYKDISGEEVTGLKAGKYWVRTKADGGMPASYAKEVTVEAGAPLTVSVPATQVGYELRADKTEVSYGEKVTLLYQLTEGFTETDSFSIKLGGKELDFKDGICTIDVMADAIVTVEGISDLTPPKAEITVTARNSVSVTQITKSWAETVTFEDFFRTIKVTIVGTDASGIRSIHYYESEEKVEEPAEIEDAKWVKYPAAGITVKGDDRPMVFYAKIADNSGNLTYVSSKGMVYDATKPVIEINDKEITGTTMNCYTTQKVTVTDSNSFEVKLKGSVQTPSFEVSGDKDETYFIRAQDVAGNINQVTINMKKIESLDEDIEKLTKNTMKPENKTAVNTVLEKVKDLLKEDPKKTEADALKEIQSNCDMLLKNINYSITSKTADLKWTKNSKNGLEIKTDAGSAKLKNVRIDEKILATTNYEYKDGTLTLNKAYLQKTTTTVGKHTIKLEYTDGETDGKDEIQILKAGTNPKTGDNSHLAVWMLTGAVSFAGLTAAVCSSRKRKHQA